MRTENPIIVLLTFVIGIFMFSLGSSVTNMVTSTGEWIVVSQAFGTGMIISAGLTMKNNVIVSNRMKLYSITIITAGLVFVTQFGWQRMIFIILSIGIGMMMIMRKIFEDENLLAKRLLMFIALMMVLVIISLGDYRILLSVLISLIAFSVLLISAFVVAKCIFYQSFYWYFWNDDGHHENT
ncbi:hypothetical protein PJ311_16220 [Bacillus sp. CLL-7-23]|uniref:Uncharacterized protein n=1 Tax=Bacillus changyiensis TaxID=3004103 RepID=A0ABT4X7E7_9BACI|nr:hypothetical protein [Bacillus changyiensis]MDA7028120.1 hypothetical protein [Bacillus changyiensis]